MMLALIEEELSAHPAVHLMTLRQAGIELMEFIIPGTSPAVGKSLSDLQLPAGTTLPLIVRGDGDDPPDGRHRLRRRGLGHRAAADRPRAGGARELMGSVE